MSAFAHAEAGLLESIHTQELRPAVKQLIRGNSRLVILTGRDANDLIGYISRVAAEWQRVSGRVDPLPVVVGRTTDRLTSWIGDTFPVSFDEATAIDAVKGLPLEWVDPIPFDGMRPFEIMRILGIRDTSYNRRAIKATFTVDSRRGRPSN